MFGVPKAGAASAAFIFFTLPPKRDKRVTAAVAASFGKARRP
jgi:hypothetical protein